MGDGVIAFGNEVECGAKTEFLFQLHQLLAFGQTGGAFDIMGEHEGEFLAVRPSRPAFRRLGDGVVDGPDILTRLAFPARDDPAQCHAQMPRQVRLEMIIKVAGRHRSCGLKAEVNPLKV